MALTRAQLLSGNISDGAILANQPQGVRPGGPGIKINTNGIIEVDSQSIVGVMKLGQTPAAAAAAYNLYDWPTTAPTSGQQLTAITVGGTTTLGWSDADGIPWTTKGQIIVGTGPATDTLLNAGANTSFLLADSFTTSGLVYSDSSTSAALMPAGNTGARPNPATPGQIRYNISTGKFEFATGATSWEEIASGDPTVSTFVVQTVPVPGETASALIPAGTTAEQQTSPAPVDGALRFNTTLGQLEVWDTSVWEGIPSSSTGSFASQTVPTAPPTATPNVVVPGGTTADRQTAPAVVPGEMRFNTTTGKLEVYGGGGLWETLPSSTAGTFVSQTIPPAGKTASAIIPPGPTGQEETVGVTGGWMRYNTSANLLEFHNGTSWELVAPSGGGVTSFVQSATPTAFNTGDLWYDTALERESVWNGVAWVQPGVSQTGPLGAAILPAGTSPGDRPAGVAGRFRYSTTTGYLEYHNGTRWVENAGGIPDLGLELEPSNSLLKAKTPTVATPPTAGIGAGQAINGSMYWDIDYGALFVRYADGTRTQWVMINGNNIQTGPLLFPPPGPGATYTAPNGLTYSYDNTKGVWTCPAGAQLGLGLALNGGFIKVSVPVATTPPVAGLAAAQAMDGSMYWDSTLGQLFIRYNDGFTTQWVAAAPPGASSVITAASLAEAAAGTINTKYSSPETAVPKSSAGMTGYAILPSSATASTTTAYLHYNTTSNHLEYGNGTTSKTALEREGDNMTGKLSVTPSAIAAGVGGWNLATSNYWTVGAIAFPLPTGLSAGQGGLIQMTAAPSSWPAAGGILKYTGGTAPAPTAFPAILPYYSDGTNVYLGKATEGIV